MDLYNVVPKCRIPTIFHVKLVVLKPNIKIIQAILQFLSKYKLIDAKFEK